MSDNSVFFSVPGVVGKERPRAVVRGKFARFYTPAKTAKWERLVRDCAIAALDGRQIPQPCEYVFVDILVLMGIPKSLSKRKKDALLHSPCHKRPDLDNVVKAVLDGASGVLWGDDAEVTRITAARHWCSGESRVEVIVTWVRGPLE
jgi:Holliday junction resolvase RusA-like endonuclease